MPTQKGKIVLMGSGELTATMVEVHKELLAELRDSPQAVFLDTPAGFQLNVDQLSQKAVEYFRSHVQYPLSIVSFKSHENTTAYAAEQAFRFLREADYVIIGPGSPTYAVRQWLQTPIPEILKKRIDVGGCLVAASAAALTVGCFTLPVYEIYKVGQELHWVEGMNLLGHFGFNLVVVPHWNNAEGGTHDTRFCYMGEPRFKVLESQLPGDVSTIGLDEHTACIIDLKKQEGIVRGIGRVVFRKGGEEIAFKKGEHFSLDLFRGGEVVKQWQRVTISQDSAEVHPGSADDSFWTTVHAIETSFQQGLEKHIPEEMTSALLELDGIIWQAQQELENPEFISQARDILRDMIALLGTRLASTPRSIDDCLSPIIEELLSLRVQFRQEKKWPEADAIRDCLARVDVVIEDTPHGVRWHRASYSQ